MTDEPTTPPGFTLIGWVARDKHGTQLFKKRPVVSTNGYFMQPGNRLNTAVQTLPIDIPHMHAAPLYVGPVIDLTPQPAVEWVTVGVYCVVECDGFSLSITKFTCGYFAEVRIASGACLAHQSNIDTLPAAQAWAVSKARELAKAKGEK